MLSETNVLILALLGGIVPALFWLLFWVREDRLRPEPKIALFSAFLGGILAVAIAIFLELILYYLLVDASSASINDFPNIIRGLLQNFTAAHNLVNLQNNFWQPLQSSFNDLSFFIIHNIDIKHAFLVIIIAPIVEEGAKLLLTYNVCLRRKVNDEPIDASIYMLTAALGFAAIETALILNGAFSASSILNGSVGRSIGPMLIHLISSAMLGIFIGLAFYKTKIKKFLYLIIGYILAVFFHALFNFFIMLNDTTHNTTFYWIACLGTWLLVFVLLLFFERVKKVAPQTLPVV